MLEVLVITGGSGASGVATTRLTGTALEVAEAILWLASAASSHCTGSILDVGGGR
jgi:NAD(P)-dependent dehydrogenase (short-subunit alcohol dehydrogenase family)